MAKDPTLHVANYQVEIDKLAVSHGGRTVTLENTSIDFPRELECTEDGALVPRCNYAHQLFIVPGVGTLEIGIHFGKVPAEEPPK